MRKFLFWCHLALGVAAGLVILLMAVTGTLLTYERQIVEWADTYTVAPGPAWAPVQTLVGQLEATSLTFYADPTRAATVHLEKGRRFVNPYTGETLGEGSLRTHAFFRFVTDWHRWLGAPRDQRGPARAVTGACNAAFLFIILSGLYLWLPRKWTRKNVRAVALFQKRAKGKARDFNWHHVIGLWSAAPLVLITLSGMVISYSWASNLVYRAYGEQPPPRREKSEDPVTSEGLDAPLALARNHVPGWRTLTLQLPKDDTVSFSIERGLGGQHQYRGQLKVNRTTGQIESWEPFAEQSPARRTRTWMRFVHTGEYYGWAGQTVAGLVSAGAAVLVYTGLALTWRRYRAWRRSRTTPRPTGEAGESGQSTTA